eukprot:6180178-Pleurochrysis_carterae.AAC.1
MGECVSREGKRSACLMRRRAVREYGREPSEAGAPRVARSRPSCRLASHASRAECASAPRPELARKLTN